jgi:uncharacterized protein
MRNKRNIIFIGFCASFLICILSFYGLKYSSHDEGRDLVNAAGLSNEELIKHLDVSDKVNLPSHSNFGWTPLISAIYHHKDVNIETLLSRGADVNLGDENGESPVMWAVEVWPENTNVISKLIQKGADPWAKSRLGVNAFDVARNKQNSAELESVLNQAATIFTNKQSKADEDSNR